MHKLRVVVKVKDECLLFVLGTLDDLNKLERKFPNVHIECGVINSDEKPDKLADVIAKIEEELGNGLVDTHLEGLIMENPRTRFNKGKSIVQYNYRNDDIDEDLYIDTIYDYDKECYITEVNDNAKGTTAFLTFETADDYKNFINDTHNTLNEISELYSKLLF